MTMEIRVSDETIEMKPNAMLVHREGLFCEWDFEKNTGLDIYNVSYGSNKKAWWICPDCKSSYDMSIGNRAGARKMNCPYCRGYRINSTNSLAFLHPDIASEWHPILNGDLTPHNVPISSNQEVWWICKKKHEWKTDMYNRTLGGNNCPYCANQKVLKGYNDMRTTNPKLASMLANHEDGYKYTQSSNQKVDWECQSCNHVIKNKMINNIHKRGLSCPRCSDGISFGEKFVYKILEQAGIKFHFDMSQKWSQGMRYDFYFKEQGKTTIIEVHGVQHYKRGFAGSKSRTLKEEQENDRLKEQLAKENGVDNYIVIDARESTMEWLKSSVLNSDAMKFIDKEEIDFEEVGQLASRSIVKDTCDLWNAGVRSTSKISESLKLSIPTISSYLKKGAKIGWCDYNALLSSQHSGRVAGKKRRKKVFQLDRNLNIIRLWNSAREADESSEVSFKNISLACRGKNKTAGGFKWMFEEDYVKMLKENLSQEEYMNKYYPKTK